MNDSEFSFEREWPATAERLKVALQRRRIPHAVIDDLVQETGLRLYQRWECVDPERGSWPLAFTVAMNILKDQLRSELRRQAITPPTTPAEQDPEAVALARLELARVRAALTLLPAAQRSALLAEIGESNDDSRSRSATKMLRMRARKRLRNLTRDASGTLGSLEIFAQRILERVQSVPIAVGASACAPLAVGLLSLGGLGTESAALAEETLVKNNIVADAVADLGMDIIRLEGLSTDLRSPRPAEDLVSAARLSQVASVDGSSGAADDARRTRSGPRTKKGHGPKGSTDVTLPDPPVGTLPPTSEPEVVVEESEASADPSGEAEVRARASGSAAGHKGVAYLVLESNGERQGEGVGAPKVSPTVKGGAQLDGEDLLELGG